MVFPRPPRYRENRLEPAIAQVDPIGQARRRTNERAAHTHREDLVHLLGELVAAEGAHEVDAVLDAELAGEV